MYRGTTPTIEIMVKGINDVTEFPEVIVVFENRSTVFEKKKSLGEVVATTNSIIVTLSQKETLMLDAKDRLYIQVVFVSEVDNVVASTEKSLTVRDVLGGVDIV